MALGSILVLGGARSGKSELAEKLAATMAGRASAPGAEQDLSAGSVTYVATGLIDTDDPDWTARVERHTTRRPPDWVTIEAGGRPDLDAVLDDIEGTALVDSLGTWVASVPGLEVDAEAVAAVVLRRAERGDVTVVVSEEVGLGVHPSTEAGRHFRDVLGVVNRTMSEVVDRAVLVVAGRVVCLDSAENVDEWLKCAKP